MLSKWLYAARPRTLPLALAGPIMASFFAWSEKKFNGWVFVFSILTTLFLQILSNYANDYGDFIRGTDNDNRIGPRRALQSGEISPHHMKIAIFVISALAFLTGIILIFFAASNMSFLIQLAFLTIGIAAISAAIKYTIGKKPYGYQGWGDVFVLFFFGIVSTLGTYFLHTQQFKSLILLPALSLGLLSSAVLNINNIRDYSSDAANNKNTLVVKIGITKAKFYHSTLISLAWLLAIAFVLIQFRTITQFLFILTLPWFVKNILQVYRIQNLFELNTELKKLALATLLFAILLGVGQVIE